MRARKHTQKKRDRAKMRTQKKNGQGYKVHYSVCEG